MYVEAPSQHLVTADAGSTVDDLGRDIYYLYDLYDLDRDLSQV